MTSLRPLLLLPLLGVVLLAGAPGRAAAERPVVVELFTSQGCSSCPPADAILGELAMRGDVLALSLHVDYWDYIGWKDPFASAEMTERQRAYARAMGSRMVYTPQTIVDGREEMVGSRRDAVMAAIDRAEQGPKGVTVTVVGDDAIQIGAGEAPPDGAVVWLVTYDHEQTTDIQRGENAGRRISYYNVVRSIERLGHWMGKALSFPVDCNSLIGPNHGAAILVQANGYGPILGATRIQPAPPSQ
ncbi:hypothetical protein SAMN06265365_105270 [Tistlia consotensis]|uniref:DUF1223 domain-containing protein n=1 Tax=Tistlia consotensis USBA 355 TaxID=560819 RepID=A0A1Y6BHP1_9PROT|nr:DUF1223 domain-containing protein [Tistlia consotensis]SMF11707.1 hypothetical protein SAMN05428998_10528 [Tistlia consotensis USBA 355]SNR51721.1 hypothetical protein SAMN06265365_105270 [Tistlia consotensis]